jgi:hypothetical protein
MKRSDVYKAIRDRLLTDFEGLTVDVNRGQMSDPKADYPLPLPLALVSVPAIRWTTIADGLQRGVITIDVDWFKALCQHTFSGAEAEEEALELLDSPDDPYQSLHGLTAPQLPDGIRRTSEREIRAGGRLIGYRVSFEADVYEDNEQ